MTEIATALASIKTAVDLAKILKNSSKTLSEAEQKLKLADIISALADTKLELSEIQSLLAEKNLKITELNQALNQKESVVYDPPYYWAVTDGKKDGPFCQRCYDDESKLNRLHEEGRKGSWKCSVCKTHFQDDSYVPEPRRDRTQQLRIGRG